MTGTIFKAQNMGVNLDWAISTRIDYLKYSLGLNNGIIQEFLELISKDTHGVEFKLLEMQIKGYLDKNTKIAKELWKYKNYKSGYIKENISIDEIKTIACQEIIGYSPIRSSAKMDWYLSPLRDDGRNPSFICYKETNSWFDYGLGEGGSVIDLYSKMYNLTLGQTLLDLKKFIKN
jgi:hypothetical protein